LSVSHIPGPIVVCMRTGAAHLGHDRPIMSVPIGPVTCDDRRDAWREAIPEIDPHATDLATRHPLDPALTAQIALDAQALGRLGARHSAITDISALIRARAGVMLPPGIDLVTPAVSWDRLVLPEQSFDQLRDAVSRLQHQGEVLGQWGMRERARASSGVRVLLTGQPGTGKSLAAEALASAASTDLLRVDTSQVVSKWIGETEENLAAAFDAAERTQAVLFMDEADALFGARTAISDAHDRYANLETAYLLQRLDHFDGMIVLATNLRNNIDAAFVRRMDFVVELPLPDVANRRRLWELHLPERLADDIDLDVIAHLYPVPGAWIRNASIAAAFHAAPEHARIRQHDLVSCIRREYAKAALPFPSEPTRRRNDM
jgi:adenylate kinase family enzyme